MEEEIVNPFQINGKSISRHYNFQLADFSFVKLIGSGNFGDVCKVLFKGHRFAVKEISPSVSEIVNIMSERDCLVECNSECVVKLIGSFIENDLIYLVMELCFGNLQMFCGKLDESSFMRVTLQILDGVEYLKKKLIIHRDLKPSNMLIGSDNNIKISDFGCARLTKTGLVVEKDMVGTYEYLAPELRILSACTTVDKVWNFSTDLYSAGISIFAIRKGLEWFLQFQERMSHLELCILTKIPERFSEIFSTNPFQRTSIEIVNRGIFKYWLKKLELKRSHLFHHNLEPFLYSSLNNQDVHVSEKDRFPGITGEDLRVMLPNFYYENQGYIILKDGVFCVNCDVKLPEGNVFGLHDCIKPLYCNICGINFRSKRTLAVHCRVIHDKNRAFTCHMCKKRFTTRFFFNCHIKLKRCSARCND